MGLESCHPAVNFLFFAAVIYGSVAFQHPVSRHLLPSLISMKRTEKTFAITLCMVAGLQQLSPFRRDGAEAELHRQQPDGGKLRVRHGDGTAGGGSVHVAELPVPGGVQRQGAVPVRQGQPTAVAVSHNFAALYSENRPGGKKINLIRRASAGEAIREMFFDDLSTACGFSPC